jgi:murein DD-endopeptidase MepM/ murein hydrolase activator NlpD
MTHMRTTLYLCGAALIAGCGSSAATSPAPDQVCSGYAASETSQYVLPYPVGASYTVIQGNCAAPGNGHRDFNRYAYDFGMNIGTPISAVRAGVVVEVEQSHLDGQVAATGFDNYIVIAHPDGTAALYGHITHSGSLVTVGSTVAQGAAIGFSGNTGNTANIPHLHFAVHSCDPVTGGSAACPTLPVTFRNTDSNPSGLIDGHTYAAK